MSKPSTDDPALSVEEAADLVGLPRPFMAARVAAGEVELRRSAVLAWNERMRLQRRAALRELARSMGDEYRNGR